MGKIITASISLSLIDKSQIRESLFYQKMLDVVIEILDKTNKHGDDIKIMQKGLNGKMIHLGYGRYRNPRTIDISPMKPYDPEKDKNGLGF